jgi:hypothetical protein
MITLDKGLVESRNEASSQIHHNYVNHQSIVMLALMAMAWGIMWFPQDNLHFPNSS